MADKIKVEKWLQSIEDGKPFDAQGPTLADQLATDFDRMEKILAFKPEDLVDNLTRLDALSTMKASAAVELEPESIASSLTSNEVDSESENDEKLKDMNGNDVFLKVKKVTLVVSPEDEAWCPITDG